MKRCQAVGQARRFRSPGFVSARAADACVLVLALSIPVASAGSNANWTAGSPLGRLLLIDDWLASISAGPPPHWRVRSPSDLAGVGEVLTESYQKEVNASRLARRRGDDDDVPVVVKSLHKVGAFAFGERESDIAYFELLYLEFLRGEPGIPWLYGGWMTPSHIVWVTANGGHPVGKGKAISTHRAHFSKEYERRAREAPLALARAWFRCFRSFGERGGFVLTDFKPEQFTLDDATGEIFLVDGPAPNSGAVAAFARRHFRSGAPDAIYMPSMAGTKVRPKHIDLEPGASWPCEDRGPTGCRKRTYRQHHCVDAVIYCENHDPGAPEITTCRDDGTCAPFDWRVHVHDAAARSWVLPKIIDVAEDRAAAKVLEELRPKMMRPDPRDRPSFESLLRHLA